MGPEESVTVTLPETADLGAPTKPVEQPKPTRREIGEWRARNFTVRHATVLACDHKIDLRRFPSNSNCFDCWFAFLESNPEGMLSVHELIQQGGTKAVEAMHGRKFVKMYGKYIQEKLRGLRAASQPEPSLEVLDVAKEVQSAQNIQIES